MQRESTNKPGTAKANRAPEVTLESASVWKPPATANQSSSSSSAPPPDWTRYIDSRLKQFCTR